MAKSHTFFCVCTICQQSFTWILKQSKIYLCPVLKYLHMYLRKNLNYNNIRESPMFLFIYLYIVYILTQICMVTKLSCGIKPKAKAVYSYDWWCMNSLQVHHHLNIENNPGKVSYTVSEKETQLLRDSL